MVILTAGDNRSGTNFLGEKESGSSFKAMIQTSVRQAEAFGYRSVVYDLGGLGFGEAFDVEDQTFLQHGYYRELDNGYRSKALHKPTLVERGLKKSGELTAYLDGDAILWQPIDELHEQEFDVAVTLRRASELSGPTYLSNPETVGRLNAGVIFFRPTVATFKFLAEWQRQALALGSDQAALNKLLGPGEASVADTTADVAGLCVKYLHSDQYNFYHFPETPPLPDTKILHFKGGLRDYYQRYF